MGANSYAVVSGGGNLCFEMWTSTKDIVPGVLFVGTWAVATSFTVFRGFEIVTSLAGVGGFGMKASIANVGDISKMFGKSGRRHLSQMS